MTKKTLFFILLWLPVVSLKAEPGWRYYWFEGVLGGGGSWYFTDIGRSAIGPAAKLGLRYKFHPDLALLGQFSAHRWKGTDAGTSLALRDYAYTAWLFESSLQAEYLLYHSKKDLRGYNSRGLDMDMRKNEVYAFLGIGAVYSKPMPYGAYINNFGESHPRWGRIVPLGLGWKHNFNEHWSVNAAAGYRFSNHDYLEGLKQGERNDRYIAGSIRLCYRFGTAGSASLKIQ